RLGTLARSIRELEGLCRARRPLRRRRQDIPRPPRRPQRHHASARPSHPARRLPGPPAQTTRTAAGRPVLRRHRYPKEALMNSKHKRPYVAPPPIPQPGSGCAALASQMARPVTLIADMRHDADIPALFHNLDHMRAYLRSKGGCHRGPRHHAYRLATLSGLGSGSLLTHHPGLAGQEPVFAQHLKLAKVSEGVCLVPPYRAPARPDADMLAKPSLTFGSTGPGSPRSSPF